MTDDTTDSGRRSIKRRDIEARIEEAKRRKDEAEERLDTLRERLDRLDQYERQNYVQTSGGPGEVLDTIRSLQSAQANWEHQGVPEATVYRAAGHDKEMSRDEIGDALANLKTRGEVYYPTEARVKVTG